MKKNLILLLIAVINLSFFSCTKTIEIDEEELKQFVIEYDDALSKGWSESDERLNEGYLQEFFASDYWIIDGGGELPWNNWYIYSDGIEITSIEKIKKGSWDYKQEPLGKDSYIVYYRRKAVAKIIENKIVPIEKINEKDTEQREVCYISVRNKKPYIAFYYYYVDYWVKEKHLPALIKRKGLVYAE